MGTHLTLFDVAVHCSRATHMATHEQAAPAATDDDEQLRLLGYQSQFERKTCHCRRCSHVPHGVKGVGTHLTLFDVAVHC